MLTDLIVVNILPYMHMSHHHTGHKLLKLCWLYLNKVGGGKYFIFHLLPNSQVLEWLTPQYSCSESFLLLSPISVHANTDCWWSDSPSLPQLLLSQFYPKRFSSLIVFLTSPAYHSDPHCFTLYLNKFDALNKFDVQISISSRYLSWADQHSFFPTTSMWTPCVSIRHIKYLILNLSFCLLHLSLSGLHAISASHMPGSSDHRVVSLPHPVNHSWYFSCQPLL